MSPELAARVAISKVNLYERLERCRSVIDDHEFCLLLFVLKHTGPEGFYWSAERIAETIGHSSWTQRKVRLLQARLTKKGFMTARPEGRGRGSKVYRTVNLPAILAAHGEKIEAQKSVESDTLKTTQKGVESHTISSQKRVSNLPEKGVEFSQRRVSNSTPELQNLNYRTELQNHKTKNSSAQRPKAPRGPAESEETWQSYRSAFIERYGHEPARNAKANSAIKRLIADVGVQDAPHIARFYLEHSKSWYVQHQHDPIYLAKDAHALRTQWINGHQVTSVDAREAERLDSARAQSDRLIRKLRKEQQ